MSEHGVDEWHEPIKTIVEGVKRLDSRRAWERENRIALLWVHAQVAIVAGLLMIGYGTASVWHEWLGPHAQQFVGVPVLIGGIVLGIGLMQRPRCVPVEIAGLAIIAAWDLALSVGFAVALFNPPHNTIVLPYPIVIYAGYLQILLVHLWTLSTRHGTPGWITRLGQALKWRR